ncbi:MAG: DUF429 domain-containing protein [Methylobacterium sp.]|nr:DUF429 domain-containing protein [Methylobacterium sp.]
MSAGDVVVVGFDAAWTDHPRKPGAICSAHYRGGLCTGFEPPRFVSFAEGLSFVGAVEQQDLPLLVALDQPTIVRNATGSRPVDKVAGSLVSWIGGGVQPANRGKLGMFDDDAPIWRFVDGLGGLQEPEEARSATSGRYLVEVFPALALAALDARFYGRLKGPRYNPARRKTFQRSHWSAVLSVVADEAGRLGCEPAADWVSRLDVLDVRKGHQDSLDALICLLTGLRWRLEPRDRSIMLGCLGHGYMVAPVTPLMHERLAMAAALRSVPIDNAIPPAVRILL